jgi:hypothetical protein
VHTAVVWIGSGGEAKYGRNGTRREGV